MYIVECIQLSFDRGFRQRGNPLTLFIERPAATAVPRLDALLPPLSSAVVPVIATPFLTKGVRADLRYLDVRLHLSAHGSRLKDKRHFGMMAGPLTGEKDKVDEKARRCDLFQVADQANPGQIQSAVDRTHRPRAR
jgi:hypothetical protein